MVATGSMVLSASRFAAVDSRQRQSSFCSTDQETVVLLGRSRSMQTVHYATVGFLIACMVWAAAMVLYKAR
jgi:hypothetical protein